MSGRNRTLRTGQVRRRLVPTDEMVEAGMAALREPENHRSASATVRAVLTEALAGLFEGHLRPIQQVDPTRLGVLIEAARLLLAFPTDEMVQAFADADEWVLYDRDQFGNLTGAWHYVTADELRAGLEAVRRTIFQEDT